MPLVIAKNSALYALTVRNVAVEVKSLLIQAGLHTPGSLSCAHSECQEQSIDCVQEFFPFHCFLAGATLHAG